MDPEVGTQPLLSEERRERMHAKVDAAKEHLEDWWAAHATSAYALITHMALCILFGLGAAFCLKMFGKLMLVGVVLLFLLLQILAWRGYVNLNWRSIGQSFKAKLDLNNDGHLGMSDVKEGAKRVWAVLLNYGLPSVGGVALGFWWGVCWF